MISIIDSQADLLSREAQLQSLWLSNRLPDPDPVLVKAGVSNQVYRENLIDSHLSAVLQKRKSGVLSMQWELDTTNVPSRMSKFFKAYFNDILDVYSLSKKVLECLYYGYQPFLLKYENNYDGTYYRPIIEDRPQEYFYFNQQNELMIRLNGMSTEGVLADPMQIITARNNPTYLNPYGEKIANKVFWWVTFKKGDIKLWLKFLEKYGMPTVMGKVPPTTSPKLKSELLNALSNFVADGVLIVNENEKIEMIDPSGKGASSTGYNDFKSMCNYEISKAVLTVANTVELGDVGSRAATDTQFSGEQKLNLDDKKIVESFFNQLIKTIADVNFSEKVYPKFFMYNEENVDESLSKRDSTLVNMGVSFTKDYYKKSYNLADEDFELTSPQQNVNSVLPIPSNPDSIIPKTAENNTSNEPTIESLHLNDAQIASAVAIVENVSAGDMPRGAGINQLKVFLGLSNEQAEAVMGDAGKGSVIKADKVVGGGGKEENKSEFSEKVKNEVIANILESVPERLLQLQMEKLLKPVIEAVNNSKSFSEITDNLGAMYPKLSSLQLEELMSKALFIARLEGNHNAGQ